MKWLLSNVTVFDNWHTSTKLMSILTTLNDIPTAFTVRVNRQGTAPNLSTKISVKKKYGEFCYSFDKVLEL